jgi:N-methylhydantoinase B/oxoprolinase/acetone carboxylase alpha subunit
MNMMSNKEVGMTDLLGNGQTLKQFRAGILERTASSGRYNGLARLHLRESDPIRYEKLFSKLRAGLAHARETARKIAARPIVEQEGELCFTLYNAAGDCVLRSTGIAIHVATMGAAIQYMIENDWESSPGINPGDMFTNNDCAIANVRPCDVVTIVPIFVQGRLIGWVGGVTHVIDTGAATPGSMSTGQTQRFGEGCMFTWRKTGVNDTPLRDWLHESQSQCWLLDERTRIAGCHRVRSLIEDVIREDGLEAYEQFAFEVIEEGRRGLQARIKAMTLPGKYRKVAFVGSPSKHEDVQTSRAFAKRDHSCMTTEDCCANDDLYLNYLRGGPGFGDPLDREVDAIARDLDNALLQPEYARNVYGVVATQDASGVWAIDARLTALQRIEIRRQRLERSIPAREWMEEERERILTRNASPQVQHMFATSFGLSRQFEQQFRDFWRLPDSWVLTEDELDAPAYGSRFRMDLSRLPT